MRNNDIAFIKRVCEKAEEFELSDLKGCRNNG